MRTRLALSLQSTTHMIEPGSLLPSLSMLNGSMTLPVYRCRREDGAYQKSFDARKCLCPSDDVIAYVSWNVHRKGRRFFLFVFIQARFTCPAPQTIGTPSAGPLPHRAYQSPQVYHHPSAYHHIPLPRQRRETPAVDCAWNGREIDPHHRPPPCHSTSPAPELSLTACSHRSRSHCCHLSICCIRPGGDFISLVTTLGLTCGTS